MGEPGHSWAVLSTTPPPLPSGPKIGDSHGVRLLLAPELKPHCLMCTHPVNGPLLNSHVAHCVCSVVSHLLIGVSSMRTTAQPGRNSPRPPSVVLLIRPVNRDILFQHPQNLALNFWSRAPGPQARVTEMSCPSALFPRPFPLSSPALSAQPSPWHSKPLTHHPCRPLCISLYPQSFRPWSQCSLYTPRSLFRVRLGAPAPGVESVQEHLWMHPRCLQHLLRVGVVICFWALPPPSHGTPKGQGSKLTLSP